MPHDPKTKSWRTDDDGHLIHDGDCCSWSYGICTCGLIHHLMPYADNAVMQMPDFWDQRAKHEDAVHKIMMINVYGKWPPEMT